jgi:NAD(P)-dependent dehydrogenase (short-subunit alcohol dehydrogenase family)
METANMTPGIVAITGAGSGIGLAAALRFGREHPLVVCDVNTESLDRTLEYLQVRGIKASGVTCDVSRLDSTEAFADAVRRQGELAVVFHAAGLSPSMADARTLLQVNYMGTANVLDSFHSLLCPGAVTICIASMSGHRRDLHTFDDLLPDPRAPGILESLLEATRNQPGVAYALSKRGVIRMVERRARDWADKGARIVSISPGVVDTPMGRKETGSGGAGNAALVMKTTPLGRFASADEIVAVGEFLCRADAGFMTGCDVLVDGGALAGFRHHATAEARRAWDHPWR